MVRCLRCGSELKADSAGFLERVALVVALTFSGGAAVSAQRPPIPSVLGQSVPTARTRLDQAGYPKVEVLTRIQDDMPPVVVFQWPDPGRSMPATTQIFLVIPKPPPRVPNLLGWRVDRALALLRALGFVWQISNPSGPPMDTIASEVTAQRPSPETTPPDSTVFLTISPVQAPAIRVDTVVQERVDTIRERQVDTLRLTTRGGDGLFSLPALGAGLLGLLLGASGCVFRPRLPRGTLRADRTGTPERPEKQPNVRKDLPGFSAVVVDEAVWIDTEDLNAGSPPSPSEERE